MLLEYEKGQIKISPMAYSIEALRKVWVSDKTRTKDNARKHFGYIYFMCTPGSMFGKYSGNELHERICREVGLPENWKPSKNIEKAMESYLDITTTVTSGLLRKAESGLHYAMDCVDNVITQLRNERDSLDKKPIEKAKNMLTLGQGLIGLTKDIPSIITKLQEVKKIAEKEESDKISSYRGGYEPGPYELTDQ